MPSRFTVTRIIAVSFLGVSLSVAAAATAAGCGDSPAPDEGGDLLEAGPDEGLTKPDGGGGGDSSSTEGVVETPADENATGQVVLGNPVQPDGGLGNGGEKTCFENPRPGCPNFPPNGSGDGGSGLILIGEDGGEPIYPPLQDPPDNPDPNYPEYPPEDPNSVVCDDLDDGAPGCPATGDPPSGCDSDINTPEECTEKAPPTCGKRIFVDLQIYGSMDAVLRSNGCWIPYAPRVDGSFRKCEYPAKFANLGAPRWFYNFVSPDHPMVVDKNAADSCGAGASDGYEFFGRDSNNWRFINENTASSYFARIFSDESHMDNYWKSYVALRKRTLGANHLFPMMNVGVPYAKFSTRKLQREVYRICKRLPNYAHLGLYFGTSADSSNLDARQRRFVAALNACTRPNKK
jgi:hypothetical protein